MHVLPVTYTVGKYRSILLGCVALHLLAIAQGGKN